jgi:prepilin-type N-terminal cleavage/methylation domain-containing protein
MKRMIKPVERGFTIIELMVSLTIGLVVTWAVTSLFTATYQTFKTQDASSRSQETGRYVLSILSQHIRQAGFFELLSTDTTSTDFTSFVSKPENAALLSVQALKGCDGTISYGSAGWSCNAVANAPSAILVAYQVQSTAAAVANGTNSLIPPGGGSISVGTDCLGQNPNQAPANPQGVVAINYFYLDTTTNKLMCQGNGGPAAKAIADGVEDIRMTYGINVSPLDPASPLQYKTASNVGTDWNKVVAVRLCVQVKAMQVTGSGSAKGNGAGNYASAGVDYSSMQGQDCQGRNWNKTGLYTDHLLRKVYWSTISVRNQTPHIPL